MEDILKQALEDAGAELQASAQAVAHLTAVRAGELSVLVGQPGYDQAVIAARDEIALAAGLPVVENPDQATSRVISIVQGGLMMLAGRLAS